MSKEQYIAYSDTQALLKALDAHEVKNIKDLELSASQRRRLSALIEYTGIKFIYDETVPADELHVKDSTGHVYQKFSLGVVGTEKIAK